MGSLQVQDIVPSGSRTVSRGSEALLELPTDVALNGKWHRIVLLVLAQGRCRFSLLRSKIGGVSAKTLTETLRALERDGLLRREVFATIPPRVEYELTSTGVEVSGAIDVMCNVLRRNVTEIENARRQFDRMAGKTGSTHAV